MLMNKKVSVRGDFAKVGEDIKDQDIITILDGGTMITGEYGDRAAFHVRVKDGSEKVLSPNQSSINNLIDAYGEDSEGWIGKRARAWVVKTMVSGKLRNVAYLAAPDWKMLDDGTFIPSDSTPVIDMAEEEDIDPEDIPI